MASDHGPINQTIHGTALVIDQKGLLITGASGSGKSRLAMSLLQSRSAFTSIELARVDAMVSPPDQSNACLDRANDLVADDRVEIVCEGNGVIATAPNTLRGLIEVRGLGIARIPYTLRARIDVGFALKPLEEIERVPRAAEQDYLGVGLPSFAIPMGDLSHQMMLVELILGMIEI